MENLVRETFFIEFLRIGDSDAESCSTARGEVRFGISAPSPELCALL